MTRRIRVVIVSEPGIAGVKRHVIDLLRTIDVESFEVHFIYSLERCDNSYANDIEELSTRGISCRQIPMEAPLSIQKDSRAFWRLVRELRCIRPDILHLHSSKAGGLGRLAALFVWPHPRVLYTPHAMACYRSKLYWGIELFLGLITSRLMATSKSELADWIRWKIPGAKKSSLVPNGVVTTGSAPVDYREIAPGKPWTFGACGRICRQKNAVLMFQTALEMLRADPDARFVWIGDYGDDEEAQSVKRLLETADNLDRIKITGWVKNAESYLASLDLFCMVSRYEGLSYVLIEAQLLGLPVVGVNAPGIIDLVHHDNTGFVSPADVESLCDALTTLRDDRSLRQRLGESAREQILSGYTVPKMVDGIEGVYFELAGRHGTNPQVVRSERTNTIYEQI